MNCKWLSYSTIKNVQIHIHIQKFYQNYVYFVYLEKKDKLSIIIPTSVLKIKNKKVLLKLLYKYKGSIIKKKL